MASVTKLSFHKRLFLQLIAFSWTIVVCFIGFQYLREKEYKSDFLSAQLQQYNLHLLVAIEDGESYEEYIATHEKPMDDLRISLIRYRELLFMITPFLPIRLAITATVRR
jgi:hypothetical protein